MFTQIEQLAQEIAEFIEMDTEHWNSNEGCLMVADQPVFYTKHSDVVELECDGVIMEVERFTFSLA